MIAAAKFGPLLAEAHIAHWAFYYTGVYKKSKNLRSCNAEPRLLRFRYNLKTFSPTMTIFFLMRTYFHSIRLTLKPVWTYYIPISQCVVYCKLGMCETLVSKPRYFSKGTYSRQVTLVHGLLFVFVLSNSHSCSNNPWFFGGAKDLNNIITIKFMVFWRMKFPTFACSFEQMHQFFI